MFNFDFTAIAAIEDLKWMEPVQQAIMLQLETRFTVYLEDPDFILATLLDPAWNISFFKLYDSGKLCTKNNIFVYVHLCNMKSNNLVCSGNVMSWSINNESPFKHIWFFFLGL